MRLNRLNCPSLRGHVERTHVAIQTHAHRVYMYVLTIQINHVISFSQLKSFCLVLFEYVNEIFLTFFSLLFEHYFVNRIKKKTLTINVIP